MHFLAWTSIIALEITYCESDLWRSDDNNKPDLPTGPDFGGHIGWYFSFQVLAKLGFIGDIQDLLRLFVSGPELILKVKIIVYESLK